MKPFTLILLILIASQAFAQTLEMPTSPLRDKLVAIADSYMGIREATGRNDGPKVRKILRNVGLPEGNAWCAALQAQVHDDCNLPNPHSAYCPDWFKSNVVFEKDEMSIDKFQAKRGQVFGLWIEYKHRVGHMGMITGESRFSYYTDEGNINSKGSDEGEGSDKYIRSKRSIHVIADYAMSREEKNLYLGKHRKIILKDAD
ncbi:MAG TPA: hypothetical protein PKH68_01400 [Paludibacteraceae bacterium]|nr:hypothetical protein [Paludibacteraceae bacterium]